MAKLELNRPLRSKRERDLWREKKPICRPAPMINCAKPRGIESLVAHYGGVPDDDRLECDAFAFNPQEW